MTIRVYDNWGKTADRYTIFCESGPIGSGGDPGVFFQHGEAIEWPHLGRKIRFQDLPEKVQNAVREENPDEEAE